MAERVARLLAGDADLDQHVSPLLRGCLRSRAGAVGLKSNFTILDDDDQRRIIRSVVKDLALSTR